MTIQSQYQKKAGEIELELWRVKRERDQVTSATSSERQGDKSKCMALEEQVRSQQSSLFQKDQQVKMLEQTILSHQRHYESAQSELQTLQTVYIVRVESIHFQTREQIQRLTMSLQDQIKECQMWKAKCAEIDGAGRGIQKQKDELLRQIDLLKLDKVRGLKNGR
jgi:endonuclease III